jgi:hypothetical protein
LKKAILANSFLRFGAVLTLKESDLSVGIAGHICLLFLYALNFSSKPALERALLETFSQCCAWTFMGRAPLRPPIAKTLFFFARLQCGNNNNNKDDDI